MDLLNNQLFTGNQEVLLNVAISIIVAIIIYFITIQLIKRYSNRLDNQLESDTHKKFRFPVIFTLLGIALMVVLNSLESDGQLLLFGKHANNLLIIFGVTWLIVQLIGMGKLLVLKRYDVNTRDNLKARKIFTQFKIIERVLVFIIILISLAIALMTFEGIRQIGVSLFASAGVAGIIIGFAAQKLIGNVLAGIQLAIAQPMRLDDVVIVEGEWGRIEEITLTFVVISIWDKRRLIVPTTYFIEKPFQNWTRETSEILGTVFIYADYKIPFDKIREELTRLLQANDNWDGKVNNMQVTNATAQTVEMRALMSTSDASSGWDLRVYIREKLIEFIQKNYPECLPRTRIIFEDGMKPDQ